MRNIKGSTGLIVFLIIIAIYNILATDLEIDKFDQGYRVNFKKDDQILLQSPHRGLWKISTRWQDRWPSDWKYLHPQKMFREGDWTILEGKFEIEEGSLKIRDAYKQVGEQVKCVRRFEWSGDQSLDNVTLSVDWQTKARNNDVMLPGILYYGNPSGAKNGKNRVPVFTGKKGQQAIFEEHRFSMPFASLEWEQNGKQYGAALHSLPSPLPFANRNDQWWSLGVSSDGEGLSLQLLSGPSTYNGKKSVVKARQTDYLDYNHAYLNIPPGGIIEKTFYLEIYEVDKNGSGFIPPIKTS
ncbi:MAG TPA: hypothetical protein VKP78_10655, partial [bacterium]|nr:hypothetical protein [bacterium]